MEEQGELSPGDGRHSVLDDDALGEALQRAARLGIIENTGRLEPGTNRPIWRSLIYEETRTDQLEQPAQAWLIEEAKRAFRV